jgi:hypothetical protein
MKAKILYGILIVFFASLLIFIRLQRVYDDTILKVYEMVPTSENGGFTMVSVEKNVSLGKDTAAVVVNLKPGQQYSGSLLVKNHKDEASLFSFTTVEGIQQYPLADGVEPRDASVFLTLEADSFNLEPHEWRFVNYTLMVPEDFALGEYDGMLSLRDGSLYTTNEGMSIAFAVGVEFKVDVTDEVQNYEYTRLIEDLNINEIAFDATLLELTKIFGLFFVFLTIFFLYKAVMIDRGKIKC